MLRQDAVGVTPAADIEGSRPAATTHRRSPVPWLIGLAVVLAIALVALGAMVVAPMVASGTDTALGDEVITAWNAGDAEAARAIYTEDAILFTSSDSQPTAKGIDEIVAQVEYAGLTIERTGPITQRGNLVWQPIHVSSAYDVSGSDAVAVLWLRDGRIAQHWVIWDEPQ